MNRRQSIDLRGSRPLASKFSPYERKIWNAAIDAVLNVLSQADYPASWHTILTIADNHRIPAANITDSPVRQRKLGDHIVYWWQENDGSWSAKVDDGVVVGRYPTAEGAKRGAISARNDSAKTEYPTFTVNGKVCMFCHSRPCICGKMAA